MRIARAGDTPTDDDALVNAVVLNGVGGPARVALRLDGLHDAGAGRAGERCLRLGLLPELVHLVVRRELAVGMLERGEHLPVRLRDVRAPLQLALHHDCQRRALHTADGQELRPETAGRERHETRQRRAPDQVDVLARLTGASQRLGQLDEVGERMVDLLLGQRRVLGALDARRHRTLGPVAQLRVRVQHLLERLEADQLALAVVVGRDHDRVRVLGLLAQRLVNALLDRLLHQAREDQLARLDLAPIRVALRESGVHQVALEADDGVLTVGTLPGVMRDAVAFALLGLPAGQDLRDLLRAVVFFCDDQSHCISSRVRARRPKRLARVAAVLVGRETTFLHVGNVRGARGGRGFEGSCDRRSRLYRLESGGCTARPRRRGGRAGQPDHRPQEQPGPCDRERREAGRRGHPQRRSGGVPARGRKARGSVPPRRSDRRARVGRASLRSTPR